MPRAKKPPNPECLPMEGEVFVARAPYVKQRHIRGLKRVQKRFLTAALIMAAFFASARIAENIQFKTTAELFAYVFGALWLTAAVGQLPGLLRDKKLLQINPLLKINDEGIGWYEAPDQTIRWQRIGGFVRKGSKVYVLEANISANPEYHNVLLGIDTALLKVRHVDLLAHLEARMAHQLERRIAG